MDIPSFESFSIEDSASCGVRWRKYLARFELLATAMNIDGEPVRKRALLLHYAGEQVYDIYETFTDAQKGGNDQNGYDTLKESLTTYFEPKKHIEFEVFKFRETKQEPDESTDAFCTRLRKLAATCDFTDTDREIKTQIISGCTSTRLRRRGLRDDLTLDGLLQQARSLELSDMRAHEMERDSKPVNALRSTHRQGFKSKQETTRHKPPNHKSTKTSQQCRGCGGNWPHPDGRESCPAFGKECTNCHKYNHFWKVCLSAKQKPKRYQDDKRKKTGHSIRHTVQNNPESSASEEENYVFLARGQASLPRFDILVGKSKQKLKFLADSGASVNLISQQTFDKMNPKPFITSSSSKIYAYGSSSPMKVTGQFRTLLQAGDKTCVATIQVVEGTESPILSWETCRALQLLNEAVNTINTKAAERIADGFPNLFDGKTAEFAKIKNVKVKLHIDEHIKPIAQRHRRIPFHTRRDVEEELEKLEKRGIIEKVEGPTPWISPVVVVPKKQGGVRLCIDMREANKAIGREKHPMPTLDDLISDLNGATTFTKLDMSQAYHQLELDEASRYITTFSTHVGLRRYKRLLFGVNAASEIFQHTISTLLSDIPGARNLSDDIIVYGRTQDDHDKALRATLQRLNDVGARLNKEKCVFSTDQLVFFGHVFSKSGIKADPEKIKTIIEAPTPKNVPEIRSFLGMTQYVSRFIPNYASTTEPLRKLTKKDMAWEWTERQSQAFENLKRALSNTPVMAYFDQKQETTVIVDASPVGVGAILTQNNKVISYASRALTPTEQRYSQTDREFLAVVYGVEHFHLYLYGGCFRIITDHKPLLGIVNSKSPTTARMERWRLRLMSYRATLEYRPGKDNPADFISRHPYTSPRRENKAEQYISYIASHAVPKSLTLEEIRHATSHNEELQRVMEAVKTGRWLEPEVASFAKIAAEISVTDGVILRGHRIVIPESLQKRVIKIAHQAHQGIVKTKQCLREKVWFPGIDKIVETEIKSCIPCQASNPQNPKREPIQSSNLPSKPWTELSMDFLGPFPSGELLLVVIDDYSRFPEVEIVSSTTSACILSKLENIFARHGYPEILKSDNGPPMNSSDFASYAAACGFKHRKITPHHPEANGEAERFMRTLNKTIRAATTERVNIKTRLPTFLRLYRATPHASTGVSPFEALYGRKMNFGIPSPTMPVSTTNPHPNNPNLHSQIVRNDEQAKLKMRTYADARRHTQPSSLKTGDTVLVKQKRFNKLTPPYCPTPYEVTARNGSMVTARRGQHELTRNSSHFKPITGNMLPAEVIEEKGEEDNTTTLGPAQQTECPSTPRPPAPLPPPTSESLGLSSPPQHMPAQRRGSPPQRMPAQLNTRASRGYTAPRPARYR